MSADFILSSLGYVRVLITVIEGGVARGWWVWLRGTRVGMTRR